MREQPPIGPRAQPAAASDERELQIRRQSANSAAEVGPKTSRSRADCYGGTTPAVSAMKPSLLSVRRWTISRYAGES